jgi:hypothetical protein
METSLLFPNDHLSIERIQRNDSNQSFQIAARCSQRESGCPRCGCSAARVHSHYQRQLRDLPCGEQRVEIRSTARKFFCDNPNCRQRIFAERFPDLVRPYRRFTTRLTNLTQQLGLLLGEPAASECWNSWRFASAGGASCAKYAEPVFPFQSVHGSWESMTGLYAELTGMGRSWWIWRRIG